MSFVRFVKGQQRNRNYEDQLQQSVHTQIDLNHWLNAYKSNTTLQVNDDGSALKAKDILEATYAVKCQTCASRCRVK